MFTLAYGSLKPRQAHSILLKSRQKVPRDSQAPIATNKPSAVQHTGYCTPQPRATRGASGGHGMQHNIHHDTRPSYSRPKEDFEKAIVFAEKPQGEQSSSVVSKVSTNQSPEVAPLPSALPPLELAFWPAAAEAKLEGRLVGILINSSEGR